MSDLLGYVSRLGVGPSEQIGFHVSAAQAGRVEVRVHALELSCISGHPPVPALAGPPLLDQVCAVAPQPLREGSYLVVERAEGIDELRSGFTIACWFRPTRAAAPPQALASLLPVDGDAAAVLGLTVERRLALTLRLEDGRTCELTADARIPPRVWTCVLANYDARSGLLCLARRSRGRVASCEMVSRTHNPPAPLPPLIRIVFAAADPQHPDPSLRGLYDGKLDRPMIWSRPLSPETLRDLRDSACLEAPGCEAPWAAWDLGAEPHSDRVLDRGPARRHARAVNLPTRAVTGVRWTPASADAARAPEAYGAIHFHSDDVGDAGWDETCAWRVPPGTPSGVYVAQLRDRRSGEEQLLPFAVTPAPTAGDGDADVVVVLPTATYLAYANNHLPTPDAPDYPPDWTLEPDPRDRYVADHPELGKSLYDVHPDGSGWCYSTRLRPLLNLDPAHRTTFLGCGRHLAADLYLLAWLRAIGVRCDITTDEHLHRHGAKLLSRYRVLVTGSHPEYVSGAILDALEQFNAAGGALLYLGGNGFYWVTSFGGRDDHYIECRRGQAGSRTWESAPGELHHSTTGELGGLWRHRGRSPNALVGVGFGAMGSGGASRSYRRLPASYDERVAWVFDGVEDEVFGGYGLSRGGAAGDELDRADHALGTPEEAVVLASADGFSDFYQLAVEDVPQLHGLTGGQGDPRVRSDIVLIDTPPRGPVFSVGSIAWSASLLEIDGDVSRITRNVLRRFRCETPSQEHEWQN